MLLQSLKKNVPFDDGPMSVRLEAVDDDFFDEHGSTADSPRQDCRTGLHCKSNGNADDFNKRRWIADLSSSRRSCDLATVPS